MTPVSAITLQRPASAQVPVPALAGALVILLFSAFGPNLDLCLFSLAVLAIGSALLWRPGESAILLITFVLSWIGASTAAFHANWLGLDVEDYSSYGAAMRMASYLSLLGILALAIGIRAGAGKPRSFDAINARMIVSRQPLRRWFKLYAAAWVFSFVTLTFAWTIPGLSQIFLAVASVKWAFFFMLAYASFVAGSMLNPFFLAAFCVEFAMGIGGFFSDFKTVFLFTIFAAFASGLKLTLKTQAVLAGLFIVLVAFGIAWSEVKEEYRRYVAEGQQEQVAKASYLQSIGELAVLVEGLDGPKLADGTTRLLKRLSYIEFFGLALNYVPLYLPHENGALLADAISRPFMPRIFFPDKAVIDDSLRTAYYTGGAIKAGQGTSISIGYMAEAYIDFGAAGMMAALVGLGCFFGLIYRFLLRNPEAGPLAGMALASAVLVNVGTLESSLTKSLASIIVSLLVAWAVAKYGVPRASWVAGRSGETTKRALKRR